MGCPGFLVPATGIEPVRILLRGILSPLCLPIPPCRRIYNTLYMQFVFPVFQTPKGFSLGRNCQKSVIFDRCGAENPAPPLGWSPHPASLRSATFSCQGEGFGRCQLIVAQFALSVKGKGDVVTGSFFRSAQPRQGGHPHSAASVKTPAHPATKGPERFGRPPTGEGNTGNPG